eukprot:3737764-Amphidinium_carterae.1
MQHIPCILCKAYMPSDVKRLRRHLHRGHGEIYDDLRIGSTSLECLFNNFVIGDEEAESVDLADDPTQFLCKLRNSDKQRRPSAFVAVSGMRNHFYRFHRS